MAPKILFRFMAFFFKVNYKVSVQKNRKCYAIDVKSYRIMSYDPSRQANGAKQIMTRAAGERSEANYEHDLSGVEIWLLSLLK